MYNEVAGVETPPQPEIPACAEHVIEWWWELDARRPPGFDSLAPITYTEICSWMKCTGRMVSYEEIDWLIQMDNAWLRTIAEERKAKRERDQEEADKRSKK